MISKNIGEDWKNLAKALNVEPIEITNIDHDYRILHDKCYQILTTVDETIDDLMELVKALQKIQRNDLIMKINSILVSESFLSLIYSVISSKTSLDRNQ